MTAAGLHCPPEPLSSSQTRGCLHLQDFSRSHQALLWLSTYSRSNYCKVESQIQ